MRKPGPTLASNRLTHGLRSNAARAARASQAELIAEDMLSSLPRSPEIDLVAHDLAEAILQLAAVRAASLARYVARDNQPGEPAAVLARGGSVSSEGLIQYERKALSRRNGLIRRLDYLSLEARRGRH